MKALQPFLNENWLDCNENLEVGNLDPLIQILQVTYYKTNSHSLQNEKRNPLSISFALLTIIISFKPKHIVYYI